MQDETCKRPIAFPRMVEDLMRGFAAREWADAIDFSTLRKLPAEYLSDELRRRIGDTVWAVRRPNLAKAVIRLERTESRSDLVGVVDLPRGPEDDGLRCAFADRVRRNAERLVPGREKLAAGRAAWFRPGTPHGCVTNRTRTIV